MKRPLVRAAILAAMTLPFIAPLARPGWLQTHEGLSYPVRQAELLRCWKDGMLSARWFPDLNYGQGYPFLSFYAPLLFYAAGALQELGASPVDALKTVTALAALVRAAGVYRLARFALSPEAALVAAAVSLYAPYPARDVYIRGDHAEHLALALLPWVLFALLRLSRKREVRDVGLIVLTGGLLLFAHNITALFGALAMAGASILAVRASERPSAAARAAAAGMAGAALVTAFFWAPALYETRFVQIDLMTRGDFDPLRHFVPPLDLFSRGLFPGRGRACR